MLSTSATHFFSKKSMSIRKDFNPVCENSALLETMMFSFRCRHRPDATLIQPPWRRWEIVNRNEDHFTCRVFVFNDVNQVTPRVKSESMLIKERRACTRGLGMAFAESRSFTGPSTIFADNFFALFQTHTETTFDCICCHNG